MGIDHENTIISKETPERKVAEFEFEAHQVFGIDIMMSSGRGKAVDRGEKCTIYKRNVEVEYPLKMKTSRELLKMINKQFPTFPFSMRNFENNRARLGITECVRSNLVQPYPILSEKHGEFVAQFKFTAVIGLKGTVQVTGLPLDMSSVHGEQQITDAELNSLLGTKFVGELPSFYDAIQTPKYDPSLAKRVEQKQNGKGRRKKNNNNNNRQGGKNRNQKNNKSKKNQKKGGSKPKRGNTHNDKQNKSSHKQSNGSQSQAPPMDLD